MDDKNDLKCVTSHLWTNANDSENTQGVLNGALSFNGEGNIVRLPTTLANTNCLFNPNKCHGSGRKGICVSMWIKFHYKTSRRKQVFWTSQATPSSTGFTVFQPEASSNISVSAALTDVVSTASVSAPVGIWFHLIFRYRHKIHVNPRIYINGERQSKAENSLSNKNHSVADVNYMSIGQDGMGLPNASFDEIIVFKVLNAFHDQETENMYGYYKGNNDTN